MKTLRRLLTCKSTQKDVRLIQKMCALFMLPMFVMQATFFNFAPRAFAQVTTQDSSQATSTQDVTKDAPDNSEAKESAPSTESVKSEKDDLTQAESEEKSESQMTKPQEKTADVRGSKSDAAKDVEASVQPTPDSSSAETSNISTPTKTESVSSKASEKQQSTWSTNGSKAITTGDVVPNKAYVAPQNSQVVVTFTKLPDNPGRLSIEQLTLSDEQIKNLGAISNNAYDITSDMADGTFAYELSLPKPKNEDHVKIKYAETLSGLTKPQSVSDSDTTLHSDSITASLDHFTIFAVTTTDASLTTSKTVYELGDTVYANATVSNGSYYKLDINRPSGTTASTSGCHNNTTSVSDSFALPYGATISSNWSVTVTQYGSSFNCNNQINAVNSSTIHFEVTKATPSVVVSSSLNPSTYGDSVTFIATVSGGGSMPTGSVVFKSDGVSLAPAAPLNGAGRATLTTSSIPAGTHSITVQYQGNSVYAAAASPAISQVVTKKNLTVSGISANTKTYDGTRTATINAGSATFSGVVGSDAVTLDAANAIARFSDKNVGTGKTVAIIGLSLSGADAGSYSLTQPITVSADIVAKDIHVSADVKSKVYGSADPQLTYDADPLISGDVFTGYLVRVPGEAVGTYDITQGTLSLNSNYNLIFAGSSLAITKANLTVTADGQIIEFGSSDPAFTFTYSGFVNGDTQAAVSVEPTCGVSVPHTAVGTYDITCSGGSADSYDFVYDSGVLSIVDTQGPTGGSISYNPVGYTNATQADITFTMGTDDASGLKLSTGRIQHNIGITNGTICTGWTGWENLIHTTSGSYSDTTIQDGKCYRYRYVISDNSGNQAIYGPAAAVKVDRSAPDTTITATTADPSNSSSATFDFIGNDGSGSGVHAYECQFDGSGFFPCSPAIGIGPLDDGVHTFEVRAIDKVGNVDPAPASYSWTVDTQAPIVSNVQVVNKSTFNDYYPYIKGDAAFRVRADVADQTPGSGLDITTCEYTLDGASWNAGTYNAATKRCIADVALAPDGTNYGVSIRVKDLAGNVGTGSVVGYTTDSAAPATSGITVNPDHNGFTTTTPTITGTISDIISPIVSCEYRYRLTGSGSAGWTPWSAGTWNASADPKMGNCEALVTDLSDGQSYDFSMRGRDSVGHFGGGAFFVTETVDVSTPFITLNGDDPMILQYGDEYVEPGATWEDNVDGSDVVTEISGSVDTSILGDYTITYTQTDSAGNMGIATRTVSVIARNINVWVDAQSKTYGDADPAFTYSSDPLMYSDEFSGALSRDPGEDAGSYEITQGDLTLSSNYNIIFNEASLAIGKKILTVMADNQTKEYLAPDPTFPMTYSPFAFADTVADIDAQPTCIVAGVHEELGTYMISCAGGTDENYDFVYVDGTLTIVDTTKPAIALNGDSYVRVEKSHHFTDRGAIAIDNHDGDITANIVETGSVDTDHSGVYYLTYTVTDASGNAASVVRAIRVYNSSSDNKSDGGGSASAQNTSNPSGNGVTQQTGGNENPNNEAIGQFSGEENNPGIVAGQSIEKEGGALSSFWKWIISLVIIGGATWFVITRRKKPTA